MIDPRPEPNVAPIDQPGVMLWKMVEKGVIDVGLTEGSKRRATKSNRPSSQMVFAEDGLVPEEGPVETSLEDFGAAVDHRERTTRIDQPSATEFGVDDRPEVTKPGDGEQAGLYHMDDSDQQTLSGKSAVGQSWF